MTTEEEEYVCPAALNIMGEHFPCRQMEQMAPGSRNHEGWAHSNPDAEAIWRGAGEHVFGREGLDEMVFTALGTASVAWESMSGTGVFQDDVARKAGESLIAWINENYEPKEHISA